MPVVLEDAAEPTVSETRAEFDRVTSELLAARAAALEAAEQHVTQRERAAALYARHTALHSFLVREGGDVPMREMPATFPGGTSQQGLRDRWLRVITQQRW